MDNQTCPNGASVGFEPMVAANWRDEHLPRLAGLALLPVGAGDEGKAPVDPSTGWPLPGWEHRDFSVEAIAATAPDVVTAVGMRCGPASGGLVCFDLDGASALERLAAAGGIPQDGWAITRHTAPDRAKVVFRVPPEHWPAAGSRRAGKVTKRTAAREQLEVFWGSGQVVVAGLHKPSGAVLEWCGGPEAIPTIPDTWRELWASLEQTAPATDANPTPSPVRGGAASIADLLPRDLERTYRDGVTKGGRNDACFRLAAAALAAEAAAPGIALADTPQDVVLRFASRCSPPLADAEALQCLRSAQQRPRTADRGLPARLARLEHPACGAASNPWQKRRRLAPDEVLQRLPGELGGAPRLDVRSGAIATVTHGTLSANDVTRLYLELSTNTETWPQGATTDAVMLLANRNQFDPVRAWLEQLDTAPLPLDQWQGLDQHLLGIDDPIARSFLPRFLISAVARVMEPGAYVRQSPVLVGPQERGKSELGRILFGAEHWVEGVGTLDRDAIQRAGSAWGVELAELDGITRRRDDELLKAFLTETRDTYRAPYDRAPEHHPRRFVFWGTANRPPLRDETGSTRFVIIPIPDRNLPLDWARANRDAIWARALEQYRSGVSWLRSDEAERLATEARNADYASEADPWAETVAEYLARQAQAGSIPVQIPAVLSELLGVETGRHTTADARRVRQIAEQLGWAHSRRRRPGGSPTAGMWPPAAQPVQGVQGVHPSVQGVHPSRAPLPTDCSAVDLPLCAPRAPQNQKSQTEVGGGEGAIGETPRTREKNSVLMAEGCTGCTPSENPVPDSVLPVHGRGAQGGARGARGAQTQGCNTPDGVHTPPARIPCTVDGEPGWSRRPGPMRGASVLVSHADGRQLAADPRLVVDL